MLFSLLYSLLLTARTHASQIQPGKTDAKNYEQLQQTNVIISDKEAHSFLKKNSETISVEPVVTAEVEINKKFHKKKPTKYIRRVYIEESQRSNNFEPFEQRNKTAQYFEFYNEKGWRNISLSALNQTSQLPRVVAVENTALIPNNSTENFKTMQYKRNSSNQDINSDEKAANRSTMSREGITLFSEGVRNQSSVENQAFRNVSYVANENSRNTTPMPNNKDIQTLSPGNKLQPESVNVTSPDVYNTRMQDLNTDNNNIDPKDSDTSSTTRLNTKSSDPSWNRLMNYLLERRPSIPQFNREILPKAEQSENVNRLGTFLPFATTREWDKSYTGYNIKEETPKAEDKSIKTDKVKNKNPINNDNTVSEDDQQYSDEKISEDSTDKKPVEEKSKNSKSMKTKFNYLNLKNVKGDDDSVFSTKPEVITKAKKKKSKQKVRVSKNEEENVSVNLNDKPLSLSKSKRIKKHKQRIKINIRIMSPEQDKEDNFIGKFRSPLSHIQRFTNQNNKDVGNANKASDGKGDTDEYGLESDVGDDMIAIQESEGSGRDDITGQDGSESEGKDYITSEHRLEIEREGDETGEYKSESGKEEKSGTHDRAKGIKMANRNKNKMTKKKFLKAIPKVKDSTSKSLFSISLALQKNNHDFNKKFLTVERSSIVMNKKTRIQSMQGRQQGKHTIRSFSPSHVKIYNESNQDKYANMNRYRRKNRRDAHLIFDENNNAGSIREIQRDNRNNGHITSDKDNQKIEKKEEKHNAKRRSVFIAKFSSPGKKDDNFNYIIQTKDNNNNIVDTMNGEGKEPRIRRKEKLRKIIRVIEKELQKDECRQPSCQCLHFPCYCFQPICMCGTVCSCPKPPCFCACSPENNIVAPPNPQLSTATNCYCSSPNQCTCSNTSPATVCLNNGERCFDCNTCCQQNDSMCAMLCQCKSASQSVSNSNYNNNIEFISMTYPTQSQTYSYEQAMCIKPTCTCFQYPCSCYNILCLCQSNCCNNPPCYCTCQNTGFNHLRYKGLIGNLISIQHICTCTTPNQCFCSPAKPIMENNQPCQTFNCRCESYPCSCSQNMCPCNDNMCTCQQPQCFCPCNNGFSPIQFQVPLLRCYCSNSDHCSCLPKPLSDNSQQFSSHCSGPNCDNNMNCVQCCQQSFTCFLPCSCTEDDLSEDDDVVIQEYPYSTTMQPQVLGTRPKEKEILISPPPPPTILAAAPIPEVLSLPAAAPIPEVVSVPAAAPIPEVETVLVTTPVPKVIRVPAAAPIPEVVLTPTSAPISKVVVLTTPIPTQATIVEEIPQVQAAPLPQIAPMTVKKIRRRRRRRRRPRIKKVCYMTPVKNSGIPSSVPITCIEQKVIPVEFEPATKSIVAKPVERKALPRHRVKIALTHKHNVLDQLQQRSENNPR